MPTKSISMQVLKRGQQVKKTVDLAEGATVKDVVSKLSQLTGTSKSSLFVAEVRNLDKVRLYSGEAPTGTFEVGGLETIEDLPEVIHVEHQVKALGLQESLQLLDDLIVAYKNADFQASLSRFQQSFLDGQTDIRQYSVLLADVAGHAQEPVFAKWGYDATTSGRMDMYAAMLDVQNLEEVRTKQLEVNRLLGQTFEWLPEAMSAVAKDTEHAPLCPLPLLYIDLSTRVQKEAAQKRRSRPVAWQPQGEGLHSGVWLKLEIWSKGGFAADEATPETEAAISAAMDTGEAMTSAPGRAALSLLTLGATIMPHCGPTNHRLRLHLPLLLPGGAQRMSGLTVAGETRDWELHRCLVFDDSFEHEIRLPPSESGEPEPSLAQEARVVLLLDLWHPDADENLRSGSSKPVASAENGASSRLTVTPRAGRVREEAGPSRALLRPTDQPVSKSLKLLWAGRRFSASGLPPFLCPKWQFHQNRSKGVTVQVGNKFCSLRLSLRRGRHLVHGIAVIAC
ncbi:Asph [Symbiodinium microadriaticum]|nr:Asph [Symbiodinium sp. KB8]CAE7305810.1 Asph [Symbiodinium microadriaticum]